jgi:primosomal protein N' (replication factor Y)
MTASSQPVFAHVVVQVGAPHLDQPFTYCVPEGLRLAVGDCVSVPFGPREMIGYVVGIVSDCDAEILNKLKDISGRIDDAAGFDEPLWRVARWVMDQTLSDAESTVRLIAPEIAAARLRRRVRLIQPDIDSSALPPDSAAIVGALRQAPGMTLDQAALGKPAEIGHALSRLKRKEIVARETSIERPQVREKTVRLVRLAVNADVAESETARLTKSRAVKQARLLGELAAGARQSEGVAVPEAGRVVDADMHAAAKALAERGLIAYHEMAVRRDPFGPRSLTRTTPPPLTDAQAEAARAIGAAVEGKSFAAFLLFGVTGSGKTEVYMDAIARARAQGRSAIFLLPEISLSAQVMDRLKARFGDEVAVLHSALTPGEWFDEWQRIRRGEAMVVVGARSAVFAPVRNLGLLIIDEEHDGSYKQDSVPRYNARDVALYRARQAGGVCVLGSATPSIESFYRAQTGLYTLLTLPDRVQSRPLPPVRILDLRVASKSEGPETLPPLVRGLLSQPLLDAMRERLDRREQTILFLNRRGFAQFLLCRDCGFTFQCPNCAVSLTYHRGSDLLQCHHCDFRRDAPATCPKCHGPSLKPFGIGTEKVEEAVQAAFDGIRTLRMDRDTVVKKGAHGAILRAFKKREADVLIGTQMVAKGLDFANVTLVGVINADTALNMPDFRASERAFQLLMQVAGRAGRGEAPGAVMVQTFNPDHDSVRLAAQHDYMSFYEIELANRRELLYPPFSTLANIVCSDETERRVIERAHTVAQLVREVAARPSADGSPPPRTAILGPVACPLERLKNRYRWHVLVRCASKKALTGLMRKVLSELEPGERMGVMVDIDPVMML